MNHRLGLCRLRCSNPTVMVSPVYLAAPGVRLRFLCQAIAPPRFDAGGTGAELAELDRPSLGRMSERSV